MESNLVPCQCSLFLKWVCLAVKKSRSLRLFRFLGLPLLSQLPQSNQRRSPILSTSLESQNRHSPLGLTISTIPCPALNSLLSSKVLIGQDHYLKCKCDAGELLGRAVRMCKGASSEVGVQRRLPVRAIFEKSPEPFQVEGT